MGRIYMHYLPSLVKVLHAYLQYRSDLLSVPGIQEQILTAKELLSDIFSSFAIVTRHPYVNTYDGVSFHSLTTFTD